VYSKALKMNQRLLCPAEVAALSIRCIKSDKLSFNEFLDDFAMKKDRTKPFQIVYCALFSLNRFDYCSFFCTYFNNDSIWEV